MVGRGEREIPEKTRLLAASSGTISTRENPGATPSGTELGSPWWEASSLTTTPPRLRTSTRECKLLSGAGDAKAVKTSGRGEKKLRSGGAEVGGLTPRSVERHIMKTTVIGAVGMFTGNLRATARSGQPPGKVLRVEGKSDPCFRIEGWEKAPAHGK
ncbi:hypothetical protein PR048_026026 [Dryococelus australis]|uniref:Uncharacterized protein n=1 Tax=Dryococelus australis TaxID=614101 RepID=A0ABQ9GK82_9NEOP|nr:hypothetical protein PR048_026026 [Dryococelus australis]